MASLTYVQMKVFWRFNKIKVNILRSESHWQLHLLLQM